MSKRGGPAHQPCRQGIYNHSRRSKFVCKESSQPEKDSKKKLMMTAEEKTGADHPLQTTVGGRDDECWLPSGVETPVQHCRQGSRPGSGSGVAASTLSSAIPPPLPSQLCLPLPPINDGALATVWLFAAKVRILDGRQLFPDKPSHAGITKRQEGLRLLAAAQRRPQSASEQEKEAFAEKEAVQHYLTCRQLLLKSMVDDVDQLNASDSKRWLEASSKATEVFERIADNEGGSEGFRSSQDEDLPQGDTRRTQYLQGRGGEEAHEAGPGQGQGCDKWEGALGIPSSLMLTRPKRPSPMAPCMSQQVGFSWKRLASSPQHDRLEPASAQCISLHEVSKGENMEQDGANVLNFDRSAYPYSGYELWDNFEVVSSQTVGARRESLWMNGAGVGALPGAGLMRPGESVSMDLGDVVKESMRLPEIFRQ